MENLSDVNGFTLVGTIVSHEHALGIPGLGVRAAAGKTNKPVSVITNEEGGFHLVLTRVEADEHEKFQFAIEVFDIDQKLLVATEASPAERGAVAKIEIRVADEKLQRHLEQVVSIKPREGRVFPAAQMNYIYGAINLHGGTQKKYFAGGAPKPGLTCPFPELEDFDNILHDAWGLINGDAIAADRFKNALDVISLSVTARGGLRTQIDFVGKHENESKSEPARGHRHAAPGQEMIPMERMALLMMAARHLGKRDQARSNFYLNLVFAQLMEYHRMRPVYETCRRAMLGDRAAQRDVRQLIAFWGEDCRKPRPPGFDDDWDPRDEPMDPRMEDVMQCLEDFSLGRGREVHEYSIDSLTPDGGCAGSNAALTGSGFGSLGGGVRFVGPTLDSTVTATPSLWTDTRIEFQIPAGATYGPVDVSFPFRRGAFVCGTVSSATHRNVSANPMYFVGGRPRIDSISFTKNGVVFDPATEVVLPGDSVVLAYDCTPNAPTRAIDVRESQINLGNGQLQLSRSIDQFNTLFQGFGGLPHSEHPLPATNYNRSTQITCQFALTNPCGTTNRQASFMVHRPATIRLRGMEVTQAIQFFRASEHIALTSEHKPDNSVPLIANKQTLVRVYYTTDQDPGFNEGKSFGLNVALRGTKDGQALSGGNALSPFNLNSLVATGDNSVNTQRGRLTSSANFLLPGTWTVPSVIVPPPGQGFPTFVPLTLTAELSIRPFEPWIRDGIDADRDLLTVSGLDFNRSRDLQCVVVRVEYTGPGSGNGAGAPPSIDNCVSTLAKICNVNPTGELDVFVPAQEEDQVITFNGDLSAAPPAAGGCGAAWGNLLDLLEDMSQSASGDEDAFWTAFLNPAIQFGVAGCGTLGFGALGVAAFAAGDWATGAHEIAHSFILPHADVSTEFPDYSQNGSVGIGEFGIDVGAINPLDQTNLDSLVLNPSVAIDFMISVASIPVWTSPFTYQKSMELVFAPSAAPSSTQTSLAQIRPALRGEFLFVKGTLDKKRQKCSFDPLYHLPGAAAPAVRSKRSTDYEILVLDSSGDVLFRCPLWQREGGNSFAERAPYFAAAQYVEVRHRNVSICRVMRDAQQFEVVDLKLEANSDRYSLRWDVKPRPEKFWCGVQVTCNDGESWSTLKFLESGSSYSFDPRKLGGGPRCRGRVFVTDGFNTAWKETDSFALPMKPPRLVPVNFHDGMELRVGATYQFQVQPIYILGVPHQTQLIWYVDQRRLGHGRTMQMAFGAGKHRIKVVAEAFEESSLVVGVVAGETPERNGKH